MMIMASVVDALCYCEERVFHDGIGEITDAQSLDIATSVLLLRTHQVQELCGMVDLSGADLLREDSLGKRDPKHVKGMNYYAQRRIEMGLEDPYAKLLVALPLAAHASGHFSLILWLPWMDELFPLNSLVLCDHMSQQQQQFSNAKTRNRQDRPPRTDRQEKKTPTPESIPEHTSEGNTAHPQGAGIKVCQAPKP